MLPEVKRKILVINSNSNSDATEIIRAKLKPYTRSGTEITCINPEHGPQGIDTYLDVAVSAVETVKLVAKNRMSYDAFIIACGSDPGLDACRQIVSHPVVGIGEAGMLLACTLGSKFSLIITLKEEIPQVEEMTTRYGLNTRIASIRAIEMTTAELSNRVLMKEKVIASARKCIDDDLAEVIVLTGSVMAGYQDEISKTLGVPVVVGLISALLIAESLLDYGQSTSKVYKYKQPKKFDQLLGYEELRTVYSGGEDEA